MNRNSKSTCWQHVLPSVIVASVMFSFSPISMELNSFHWWPTVQAAEDGHGSEHSSAHGRGHDSGHTEHGDEDEGHSGHNGRGSQGGYRGGGSHDMSYGGGKAVERMIFNGRRPVWAQEGIPEVELGRLNVSRAPSRVLIRAEDEALANYLSQMSVLYSMSADDAAQLLQSNFQEVARYDSPLQNLALYKDVMIFGDTQLNELDANIRLASQLDLAAIFLGSASDKTIPISEDTVTALNRILGLVELNSEDRTILATKAETVRQAILIGHGPTEDH